MGHTADLRNYTVESNIQTGILLYKNTSETLLRLVVIISLKILPVSGKCWELWSTRLWKVSPVELSVCAQSEFKVPNVQRYLLGSLSSLRLDPSARWWQGQDGRWDVPPTCSNPQLVVNCHSVSPPQVMGKNCLSLSSVFIFYDIWINLVFGCKLSVGPPSSAL